MSTSREKLLAQFRELVTERLARVSRSLMSLEAGADVEAGKAALRELHGLKGEARMMGFAEVNALVHEMEELVRATHAIGYALAGGSVDALLVVADAVAVLAGAAKGEPPDVKKLLEWLKAATAAEKQRAGEGTGQHPVPGPSAPPQASGAPVLPPPGPSAPAPVPSPSAGPATGSQPAPAPIPERADASIRISQQSLEVLTSTVTNLSQRARRRELNAGRRHQLARELVHLHRLAEDLGPEAAELASRLGKAKELAGEVNRLSTLVNTDELRDLTVLGEEITALRMVPVSLVTEPYARMVRELARELGKDVDFRVDGDEERVDRSVLDALKDPLLHLVRNAVDHGLETRAERAAAGKPQRGALQVHVTREGERLVLRVEDDGRGLDPAHLKQAAVRKGLLTEAAASAMDDDGAIELIFVSGFSSREGVTDLSGRGVGLDVVRTNLLAVGGEVTVQSAPGKGAAFELRVPISLTVAPVLFVQVGDERLCLTASNVLQAVQVQPEQVREIAGKAGLKLNDEVLPFASVASILGAAPERTASEGELVLVLRGRGQSAAIAVDRVLEERVQAILPLKGLLSRYPHLSGATPLADGSLALVLSAPHLVSTVHGRELKLAAMPARRREVSRRVLVVDDSPLTRELLVQLLESVGYHVVQAGDGAEALERLAREAVDIVVSDLEMPVVDGLELTRRLKSHPTLRSLPVVIVTTRGSEADRRRGMEAGADGYVTKGDLVRQDLVDVVSRLLA
ncbi:MAG: response regulator [Myxococcales bacterium]|nr:response regulator [Myxococcales bacterium]